ncbi:hypothetical protein L6V77_25340 [Myxococcota bacterium]|nr:hypothetical protein [Myxococcota bacterium]
MVNELRTILIRCLEHAPAVALCDARHPELTGLPVGAETDRALALRFCVPEDREALAAADGATFAYAYGTGDGERAEVRVPWAALLAVTGILEPGKRVAAILPPQMLPDFLGAETIRKHTVEQMLACFSSLRVPAAWRFGGDAPVAGGLDAAPMPDKREALLALAARPEGRLVLLVRFDVEGLRLNPPGPSSGVAEVPIARQGLRTNGLRIEGQFQTDGGPHGAFSIPWGALVALQDRLDGRGWGWPDDVPDEARAALLGDAADALAGCRGVPLRAPAPLPLLALPAPPEEDKRHALLGCMRQGGALLLVSTQAENFVLTGDFGDLPLLSVPLGILPELGNPDTEITGLYVRTTMPDFSGRRQRLTIPWNAIFGIATNEGGLRVHAWSADYPEIVRATLRAGHHLGVTGEVRPEPGLEAMPEGTLLRAPGLGLTREEGQVRAVLLQPFGPEAADGTRPSLQLDFMLPLESAG